MFPIRIGTMLQAIESSSGKITEGRSYRAIQVYDEGGCECDGLSPYYVSVIDDKGNEAKLFVTRFKVVPKRNLPNWF